MSKLRVGTRGSDLALWQTGWVCDRLREAHPGLEIERIIIKTHGDVRPDEPFGGDLPVGAFVTAIERALQSSEVDFAVHSYKDLQTAETAGLTIAAVPVREVVHDVLLSRAPVDLARVPNGFRLGTSSPRRAAQFRRLAEIEVVAIRGNVPTRVAKLESDKLDGVVLAGAGLKRLGITHPHMTALPTDRFPPAPAQGALAVQTRSDDPAQAVIAAIDHRKTRRAVDAERSFLRTIAAGCHTPVAALGSVNGDSIRLHAQLFSDDYTRVAEGVEEGGDPVEVGAALARRLLHELG
ncbi:MAG: hydroxymethylbilane synthase [Phycisphaerae bacterium]|nr:hydroxymethylbilane synthase [Phycisphaerae bacterium]